jgi:hypothetical protein
MVGPKLRARASAPGTGALVPQAARIAGSCGAARTFAVAVVLGWLEDGEVVPVVGFDKVNLRDGDHLVGLGGLLQLLRPEQKFAAMGMGDGSKFARAPLRTTSMTSMSAYIQDRGRAAHVASSLPQSTL